MYKHAKRKTWLETQGGTGVSGFASKVRIVRARHRSRKQKLMDEMRRLAKAQGLRIKRESGIYRPYKGKPSKGRLIYSTDGRGINRRTIARIVAGPFQVPLLP